MCVFHYIQYHSYKQTQSKEPKLMSYSGAFKWNLSGSNVSGSLKNLSILELTYVLSYKKNKNATTHPFCIATILRWLQYVNQDRAQVVTETYLSYIINQDGVLLNHNGTTNSDFHWDFNETFIKTFTETISQITHWLFKRPGKDWAKGLMDPCQIRIGPGFRMTS